MSCVHCKEENGWKVAHAPAMAIDGDTFTPEIKTLRYKQGEGVVIVAVDGAYFSLKQRIQNEY